MKHSHVFRIAVALTPNSKILSLLHAIPWESELHIALSFTGCMFGLACCPDDDLGRSESQVNLLYNPEEFSACRLLAVCLRNKITTKVQIDTRINNHTFQSSNTQKINHHTYQHARFRQDYTCRSWRDLSLVRRGPQ